VNGAVVSEVSKVVEDGSVYRRGHYSELLVDCGWLPVVLAMVAMCISGS